MASWTEELFPPKFKVNDLFEDDQTRLVHPRSSKRSQQIYEDVYKEMLSSRKDKETLERDDSQEQVIKLPEGEEPGPKMTTESCDTEEAPEDSKHKCIWSEQELKILRDSLKCSKLNNIRLSVLTQALQKDCERVRSTCRQQAREILKINKKYNDVKKQNKAMKVTCAAFKEDARNAQEDLELCQDRLKDAIRDKKSAELELVSVKHELESVGKRKKVLQLEVAKQRVLQEKCLENQNISLRSRYEKEITDLLERLEETKLCLEKERNEHCITKKALAHLRLHFAREVPYLE